MQAKDRNTEMHEEPTAQRSTHTPEDNRACEESKFLELSAYPTAQ